MSVELDIPLHAKVLCSDGAAGRSVELVIDPKKQSVTHVVVKEKKSLHEERLVPVEMILGSTAHLIRLQCSLKEFSKLDVYYEKELFFYQHADMIADPVGNIYVFPMKKPKVIEHRSMTKGELPLERNSHILATDGQVGHLDEILIDPVTDQITHLVIRENHIWGARDVTIPITQIDRIDEREIHLKLNKKGVKDLPVIPIRR